PSNGATAPLMELPRSKNSNCLDCASSFGWPVSKSTDSPGLENWIGSRAGGRSAAAAGKHPARAAAAKPLAARRRRNRVVSVKNICKLLFKHGLAARQNNLASPILLFLRPKPAR